jgi:long-chain acyl-CoA synthetase
MNIAQWLAANAARHPEKPAIVYEGRSHSHAELFKLVQRCGNAFARLGVKPGDRVSLFLPNCPEWLIARWGALAIGAASSPMNVMFQKNELRHVLNDAAPRVLVTTPDKLELVDELWHECPSLEHVVLVGGPPVFGTHDFAALLADAPAGLTLHDCAPDAMCDLYYTSGTTGRPKGVMCSHANFASLLAYETIVWRADEDDRFLVALPLFHAKGLIIPSLIATYAGATQWLLPRWDTGRVLRLIEDEKITFFAGVPTMYTYMLADPLIEQADLSSLRLARVGGAPIPVEVHMEFERRTGVKLIEGYGCTGWTGTSHPLEGDRVIGSIGRAFGEYDARIDTEIRIVDADDNDVPAGEDGELVIRGGQIPKGFWRLPGKTRHDYRGGWFHTGDIARRDAAGFIFLVGRKDDLIITAGFNVYPREIEELLYKHEAVLEAAVMGVDDAAKGQLITAFVVMKDGARATEQQMIDYCRAHIAHYKAPRVVKFVAALPKTGSGKIQKRLLLTPAVAG